MSEVQVWWILVDVVCSLAERIVSSRKGSRESQIQAEASACD